MDSLSLARGAFIACARFVKNAMSFKAYGTTFDPQIIETLNDGSFVVEAKFFPGFDEVTFSKLEVEGCLVSEADVSFDKNSDYSDSYIVWVSNSYSPKDPLRATATIDWTIAPKTTDPEPTMFYFIAKPVKALSHLKISVSGGWLVKLTSRRKLQ